MRIVLTRLDRIGDLVLSTPAIASVRRSWPGAHVAFVASRYNASVVEANPDIDELLRLPDGVRPAAYGERFRGYDLAIALAPRTSDWQLVGGTKAQRRIGYTYVRRFGARLTSRRYLTDTCISDADPALSECDPARPVRHEVEQVLELVRRAGGNTIVTDLVLPIDDAARARAALVPAGAVVLHLAPRWLDAGSSLSLFVALLGDLRRFGSPVVVTHGDDVRDAAREIDRTGMADAVVGGLDFSAWAAAFERSRLVVTVDTGATHVASAVRRPVVVVFERRYFELASREWAPYRVPHVTLRKPAIDNPEGARLLREEIVAAAQSLLTS